MEPAETTRNDRDSHAPDRRGSQAGGYLAVVFSDAKVESNMLLPPERRVLGRGACPDGSFSDERISKQHLELDLSGPVARLRDLGSRNGTHLNGRRVPAEAAVPLCDGDVLRAGNTLAVYREGAPPADEPGERWLPGRSPGIVEARTWLRRMGPLEVPLLLLGETGTGKEWAAQGLRAHSMRPNAPFIPVNCSELAAGLARSELFGHERGAFTDARASQRGLIAEADGGLLFFDEIGELESGVQAALLRFMEDRTYRGVGSRGLNASTARIVAATHVDLDLAVQNGTFRRDLLARLRAGGRPIRLPPLRERREDILLWTRRLLDGHAPAFTAGFVEALLLNDWPENLRGLRSAVATSLMASDGAPLAREHLPREVASVWDRARLTEIEVIPARPVTEAEPDRASVERALVEAGGVMRQAALALALDRRKLYRLCERFQLDPEAFRDRPVTR